MTKNHVCNYHSLSYLGFFYSRYSKTSVRAGIRACLYDSFLFMFSGTSYCDFSCSCVPSARLLHLSHVLRFVLTILSLNLRDILSGWKDCCSFSFRCSRFLFLVLSCAFLFFLLCVILSWSNHQVFCSVFRIIIFVNGKSRK